MELDVLTEAIDQLVGSDPSAYADAASMEDLHRQLARLDGFVTTVAGAFDTSGDWASDGAQGAAPWLATRCHLPKGRARRRVALGRHLRHLPACERAWLEGAITADHVGAIAAMRRDSTAEALARDEQMLVAQATNLRFEAFTRALAYWEQLADPEGTEESAEGRRARRDVYLKPSFGAMFLGRMTLDPISGAIVAKELERIEAELFRSDWREATERLGHEPRNTDLDRTPAQRRADALVEMAARSATAAPGGRRPAPLFSVLVGYETLYGRICELASGVVVSPGSLVPWLGQADIERVVFAPGRRVEVSATARLFSGATRRAIELRDRRCTHPYCDQSVGDCQVDHVIPYTAGGPTTQENGRLLCGFHNRLRHPRPPPGS